jgi:signal transduction histidine kinase
MEKDHMIRFQVADNGIGMDNKTKEKLFASPFSTKGERGTGLGLLVTEKIVKESGGVINVTSELGKGTSFTIRLPYREAQKKANIGG